MCGQYSLYMYIYIYSIWNRKTFPFSLSAIVPAYYINFTLMNALALSYNSKLADSVNLLSDNALAHNSSQHLPCFSQTASYYDALFTHMFSDQRLVVIIAIPPSVASTLLVVVIVVVKFICRIQGKSPDVRYI